MDEHVPVDDLYSNQSGHLLVCDYYIYESNGVNKTVDIFIRFSSNNNNNNQSNNH
jgi:hypothetical protein